MKVFIAGIDGYLGWSLAQYLAERGHIITGCDSLIRRAAVADVGGQSAIPIEDIMTRVKAFNKKHKTRLDIRCGDIGDHGFISECLRKSMPDAIVHLAAQAGVRKGHRVSRLHRHPAYASTRDTGRRATGGQDEDGSRQAGRGLHHLHCTQHPSRHPDRKHPCALRGLPGVLRILRGPPNEPSSERAVGSFLANNCNSLCSNQVNLST